MTPQGTARRVVVAVVCAAAMWPVAPTARADTPAAQAHASTPVVATTSVAADEAERPLVIVLDTSGSMSEDDGTGTIKLAGAQAALSQVIRQQRPGAQIGLWTYPGSASCDGGSFAIPVSSLDQRTMIAKIRGLTAAGDTPTAEALRATVDQLKVDGYSGATLLLISDGLSTCESPCETAQEVVAEGFDLTVQAAGFQISPEGLAELKCIADATGGDIFEATDGDELAQVTQQATRAALEIQVEGIPVTTPAGSASRVTVTVTNSSAIDVENARIQVNFTNRTDVGQTAIVPAALPPIRRLGRVHAGDTVTREWVVAYGTRGKTGSAAWKVAAWGTNARSAFQEGTVAVTSRGLNLDDAGGVIKALKGKRIAIVGDSYASGEGGGDYIDGTDIPENRCHKSRNTYMYPLFDGSDVELLACSGAKTPNVDDRQVELLRERQEKFGPVSAGFMSIGGNDIGFGDIIIYCLFGHPNPLAPWTLPAVITNWDNTCSDDPPFRAVIDKLISDLPAKLERTYRLVYDELNRAEFVRERDGLVAPLYIIPYPQAFPEQQYASRCPGFDAREVGFANDLVDDLDAAIEQTVTKMRKRGYRVAMVRTVQGAFLPDNTVCPRKQAEPYMHAVDVVSGVSQFLQDWHDHTAEKQEFMHPNELGYAAETDTILSWSVGNTEVEGDEEWRQGRESGLFDSYANIARAITPTPPDAEPATYDATAQSFTNDPMDLRGGQSVRVRVVNAAPYSPVLISLASRTTTVGDLMVGPDGTGSGTITIPRTTAAGGHRLTVLGFDDGGNPSVGSQTVDVARALPFWLLPLGALTLMALALSWLLARRHRRAMAARGSE